MSEEIPETKHVIKIYTKDKAFRIPKEVTENLKGVISGKVISRMRKEAIDCPVLNKELPFLECFVCKNFIRRIKGEVHCAGLPL
jgi:hypothetical protein